MMLFQCGLLLSLSFCVHTVHNNDHNLVNSDSQSTRFSYWSLMHSEPSLSYVSKRNLETIQNKPGPSEGHAEVGVKLVLAPAPSKPGSAPVINQTKIEDPIIPSTPNEATQKEKAHKVSGRNETVTVSMTTNNETISNISIVQPVRGSSIQMDFNNPGAIKRAGIVFGGFLLLGVAYILFYRRKGNKNDASNTHHAINENQFRYGVLQSDDRRDNLELSQVPLTMESEDDDDEDLEIFDLGQKKKSLSYVNLEMNDKDIVFNKEFSRFEDKDNLLLDIEDEASDVLINWSNNSNNNKSIL